MGPRNAARYIDLGSHGGLVCDHGIPSIITCLEIKTCPNSPAAVITEHATGQGPKWKKRGQGQAEEEEKEEQSLGSSSMWQEFLHQLQGPDLVNSFMSRSSWTKLGPYIWYLSIWLSIYLLIHLLLFLYLFLFSLSFSFVHSFVRSFARSFFLSLYLFISLFLYLSIHLWHVWIYSNDISTYMHYMGNAWKTRLRLVIYGVIRHYQVLFWDHLFVLGVFCCCLDRPWPTHHKVGPVFSWPLTVGTCLTFVEVTRWSILMLQYHGISPGMYRATPWPGSSSSSSSLAPSISQSGSDCHRSIWTMSEMAEFVRRCGWDPCSALCRHIAIMLGPGSKSKEKKDGEKGGAADVCILIVDICGLIVAEISFWMPPEKQ